MYTFGQHLYYQYSEMIVHTSQYITQESKQELIEKNKINVKNYFLENI